ncbi:MAG: metalloregulator ArsR/SmtB family transcription factor [Bacteroidetes bacterium]|nr:metalloregulator ArsR/SmtB family transcription factor [Bacteroidota bacterium]
MRRDVFQAIADPTRRGILATLLNESQNLNSLSEQFDMSRQAVSLHVKILQECGVISIKQNGRERYCELQVSKLEEVADWLEPFRKAWDDRFDQLDNLLINIKNKKKQ